MIKSSHILSSSSTQPPIHPYLGLALGVCAVSAASLLVKAAQDRQVPSLVIAADRLTLAALLLAPLALTYYRAELIRLNRRDLLWAILTGACLGLHFATWITSLEFTSIASSVVFVSTTPLFVAAFSIVVWRETLGAPLKLGLMAAILGGLIVGLSDACAVTFKGVQCPSLSEFLQGRAVIGDLLALAGAGAMASYLLIGRSLRAKLSLIPYIFLGYGIAGLTLLIAAGVSGQSFFGYAPEAYVWIILLALVPQLIGHSSFNWALRYLSATYVSITILGEPIGSTLLAWLVLNQIPPPLKVLGGVLILGGILIASKR